MPHAPRSKQINRGKRYSCTGRQLAAVFLFLQLKST